MTDRGLKRLCADCGARFYDLNKTPIICPSCKTEYSITTVLKAKRGKDANDSEKSVTDDTTKKSQTKDAVDDGELEDDDNISLDDLNDEEVDDDNDDDDEDAISFTGGDLDLDDLDDVDDIDDDDDLDDLGMSVDSDDDDR